MLFPDTSVWSLILRRDTPPATPHVKAVRDAIVTGQGIVTTGLVVQELLQGVSPKNWHGIIDHMGALPLLIPDLEDHVSAAGLRNACRQRGVQVKTIDALLAQLCIRHELTMISTDQDFGHIAQHSALKLWPAD